MTETVEKKGLPRWPLYVTIFFGLLVGLIYSFGALSAATGKHKVKKVGPYEIEFSIRGEKNEGQPVRLPLLIASENKPRQVKLFYYSLNKEEAYPVLVHKIDPPKKEFNEVEMFPAGKTGYYVAKLRPLKMAERYYYYFGLIDEKGNVFTYPEKAPADDLKTITYRGEGDTIITVLHIALIALVVLFFFHAIYYTLMHLASGGNFPIRKTISNVIWANIFFFLTSFPIGCWVAYKAYGLPWTGVPIVWDPNDVDNKSLLIFVYWVAILLLIKGVTKGKNVIGRKAFAWLAFFGSLATIYLFLGGGHN